MLLRFVNCLIKLDAVKFKTFSYELIFTNFDFILNIVIVISTQKCSFHCTQKRLNGHEENVIILSATQRFT